jgi:serine/threonine protein kinase
MPEIYLPGNEPRYMFVYPDSRIGVGAMSILYKGIRLIDNEVVAIKVLIGAHANNANIINLFRQGFINIDNNHIMDVYDYVVTDAGAGNRHHLILEYIEGEVFGNVMSNINLNEDKAIAYIIQLLDGVKYLHNKGYIHRDLKPNNLMLGKGDYLKIIDFDTVVKFDENYNHNIFIGTPEYSSPEQLRKESLDPRSDLWSCGIILFEILFKQNPFKNATDLKGAILKDELIIPNKYSKKLTKIIAKSLEKDKNKRYPTAQGFLEDLKTYQKRKDSYLYQFYDKYFLPGTIPSYLKVVLISTFFILLAVFISLLIQK